MSEEFLRQLGINEEQKERFSAIFHLQDYDHSGSIEWEDWEAVVVRWASNFNIPADSEAYKTHRDQTRKEFERILAQADTNKDGKISHDEYITWASAWQRDYKDAKDLCERAAGGYLKTMFTEADKNKTNTLDAGEFAMLIHGGLFPAGNITKELAQKEFESLGIKGEMTLDQFADWSWELWTGKTNSDVISQEILRQTEQYRKAK
eukprot:TRINITY_DN26789_c0_g1_i1.p1 TRINITY_DN26789_c0_g1~~TRINITY_DN26789_c0_g1_i1.p1  ORF type:complete len:206 (-),score=57.56 TRINITY_DN26789_c0_g1_i1:47-664(-)